MSLFKFPVVPKMSFFLFIFSPFFPPSPFASIVALAYSLEFWILLCLESLQILILQDLLDCAVFRFLPVWIVSPSSVIFYCKLIASRAQRGVGLWFQIAGETFPLYVAQALKPLSLPSLFFFFPSGFQFLVLGGFQFLLLFSSRIRYL